MQAKWQRAQLVACKCMRANQHNELPGANFPFYFVIAPWILCFGTILLWSPLWLFILSYILGIGGPKSLPAYKGQVTSRMLPTRCACYCFSQLSFSHLLNMLPSGYSLKELNNLRMSPLSESSSIVSTSGIFGFLSFTPDLLEARRWRHFGSRLPLPLLFS